MDNLRHTVALYDHNANRRTGRTIRKVKEDRRPGRSRGKDLQKKKKLEKEIDDNNKEQTDQQKELEKRARSFYLKGNQWQT